MLLGPVFKSNKLLKKLVCLIYKWERTKTTMFENTLKKISIILKMGI